MSVLTLLLLIASAVVTTCMMAEALTFTPNKGIAVYSAVFSPNQQYIAATTGKTVTIFNATTGNFIAILPGHNGTVLSVAFSPDGQQLLTASSDQTVRLWDKKTGSTVRTFIGHTDVVWAAAFIPHTKHVVSCSADTSLRIWDTTTGKEVNVLLGHMSSARSLAVSPDGKTVLSGSYDHTARLWNATSGAELFTLRGHKSPVTAVAYSPDGHWVASCSQECEINSLNSETGHLGRVTKVSTYAMSVAFSSDSLYFMSGEIDLKLHIHDVNTGAEVAVLSGHTDTILDISYSQDGERALSGGMDGTVRVWELSGVECIQGDWSAWTYCADPDTNQSRVRFAAKVPLAGGMPCDRQVDERPCQIGLPMSVILGIVFGTIGGVALLVLITFFIQMRYNCLGLTADTNAWASSTAQESKAASPTELQLPEVAAKYAEQRPSIVSAAWSQGLTAEMESARDRRASSQCQSSENVTEDPNAMVEELSNAIFQPKPLPQRRLSSAFGNHAQSHTITLGPPVRRISVCPTTEEVAEDFSDDDDGAPSPPVHSARKASISPVSSPLAASPHAIPPRPHRLPPLSPRLRRASVAPV